MSSEIKEGQTWEAKHPERLKSSRFVQVLSIRKDGLIQIERFYPSRRTANHDTITPQGLRRLYRLTHEQWTLGSEGNLLVG